jgi:hypothetical protein
MAIFQSIVGLFFAGFSLAYWIRVAGKGEDHFRESMERRFGVEISRTLRGHWKVRSGGPWIRGLGIELLQIAYFLVAFAGWSFGLGVVFGLMSFLE